MHRFVITFTALLFVAFSVTGQQRVVDEVKKNIGDLSATAKTYRDARTKLKPALTHADSKDKAETWWTATRVEWGLYDKLANSKSLGQKVDEKEMGQALIDGYDHSLMTLKLDTVRLTKSDGTPKIDKSTGKQRVKTKYSRDIVKRTAHYRNDFMRAGTTFYNSGKWAEAYKAFGIYHQLSTSTPYSQLCRTEPDSVIGKMLYYQALAATQLKNYTDAHKLLTEARSRGYKPKAVFDCDINVLVLAGDSAGMVQVAQEAFQEYGSADIQYMRIMINDLVRKRSYRDAEVMLDQAILRDSTNAEYFDLKGNIVEIETGYEQARPYYLYATQLDTAYAQAFQDAGRCYYLEALNYKERHPKLPARKLHKAVTDLYNKALPLIERAHALAPKDETTRGILRDIYYKLGLGDKLVKLEREQ